MSLALLIGCSQHRMFLKDYITLSESPCIDGTILNIDQAGCEGFYWGTDHTGDLLKVRCTYAPENNFWTQSSFYAVPHDYDLQYSNWGLYCEDRHVKMYTAPMGVKLESEE